MNKLEIDMYCKTLKECFTVDLERTYHINSVIESFSLCIKSSGALAVVLFRLSQYFWQKKFLWRLSPYVKRLNEILTGFECHLEAKIGRCFFLAHTQNTVVGAGVVLGENVTLYNGVTLGAIKRDGSDDSKKRYPQVGNNVTIYTGAKLIGPIIIGNDAVIGANSVVLKNVPDGCIAVGVPAKILSRDKQ